jgi:DNA gyrase subunit A
MVQRTSVRGINRYGRSSQGVRVMNIRDDDQVSAVALVVDSEATAAPVIGEEPLGGVGEVGVDIAVPDAESDMVRPDDDAADLAPPLDDEDDVPPQI